MPPLIQVSIRSIADGIRPMGEAGLWSGRACVHPGLAPIHGRAGVLRSWAAVMAGTPYLQFVLIDLEVQVHGETAVVTCTENMLSAPDGMPTTSFAGGHAVATNVFRRTGSGWRLWLHHASPVLQPGTGR